MVHIKKGSRRKNKRNFDKPTYLAVPGVAGHVGVEGSEPSEEQRGQEAGVGDGQDRQVVRARLELEGGEEEDDERADPSCQPHTTDDRDQVEIDGLLEGAITRTHINNNTLFFTTCTCFGMTVCVRKLGRIVLPHNSLSFAMICFLIFFLCVFTR